MNTDDLKNQSTEEILQKMCNKLDGALKHVYETNQDLHPKQDINKPKDKNNP